MSYKIGNECEENNISIHEEPFCECCGILEPYDAVWCDGGTWWCLDCAVCNDADLTKKEIKEIAKLVKEEKIMYFEKRISELKR